MERLRKELEPNFSDNLDVQVSRFSVLYIIYSLGARGMSIPQGKILENANTVHAIMKIGEGTPLSDVDTDKVLEIVKALEIPALRSNFEATSVPGADCALEAFGEMISHSIVYFSRIAILSFNVIMQGINLHKYRKQDHKKAANIFRTKYPLIISSCIISS